MLSLQNCYHHLQILKHTESPQDLHPFETFVSMTLSQKAGSFWSMVPFLNVTSYTPHPHFFTNIRHILHGSPKILFNKANEVLLWWCMVPQKLAKFVQGASNLCFGSCGPLLHVGWDCPRFKRCWTKGNQLAYTVQWKSFPINLYEVLLHVQHTDCTNDPLAPDLHVLPLSSWPTF